MAIRRKCTDCEIWTEDSEFCQQCGKLIDIEKKRQEEKKEKLEKARALKTPDAVDKFLHNFKHSRFFLIRAIYFVLYSVWFILASIVSFFMFMTAAGPG